MPDDRRVKHSKLNDMKQDDANCRCQRRSAKVKMKFCSLILKITGADKISVIKQTAQIFYILKKFEW